MKLVEFELFGEKLTMRVAGVYKDLTRAVRVECADGTPYSTLTVCVPGWSVGEGEFLCKTWSENEDLFNHLVGRGIVKPLVDRTDDRYDGVPVGNGCEAIVCGIPQLEE